MKIDKKIKEHFDKLKFVRITRKISKNNTEINRGFIIDYSDELVILREVEDFNVMGFLVFEKSAITKIRYNKNDAYYDKIVEKEGLKENLKLSMKLRICTWEKLLRSLKKNGKYVIIECEHPKINTFTIGEIVKVSNKKVFIKHFNARGRFNREPIELKFKYITKVTFDDKYIEVFRKYTRERKSYLK